MSNPSHTQQPFPVLKSSGPAYRKRQALANAPFFAPRPDVSPWTGNKDGTYEGRRRKPGHIGEKCGKVGRISASIVVVVVLVLVVNW